MDPTALLGYSQRQRDAYGLTRFRIADPHWWVSGEARNGTQRWIPAALVFSPFADWPSWAHPGYASSNGAAAHQDRDESQTRAWLELNERDAFLRMYMSRRPPARLDPDILPGGLRQLLSALTGPNFDDAAVFIQMTSSLGIVTHGCLVRHAGRVVVGASAQTNAHAALCKAAAEVAMQLHFPLGNSPIAVADVRTPEDHSRLYATPEACARVAWMFDGDVNGTPVDNTADLEPLLADAAFYTVEADSLFVSRAIDTRIVQMVFGYDVLPEENETLRQCSEDAWDTFPHPFA